MQWWVGEKSSREANLGVDHGCVEDTGMDREDRDLDHAGLHLPKNVSSVDKRIHFLATHLRLNPCRSADHNQKNISVRTCSLEMHHTIHSVFNLIPIQPRDLDLVQMAVLDLVLGNH